MFDATCNCAEHVDSSTSEIEQGARPEGAKRHQNLNLNQLAGAKKTCIKDGRGKAANSDGDGHEVCGICVASRVMKPNADGTAPRLNASAATSLGKPGTKSKCTQMRKSSCSLKKLRKNRQTPRANERPLQAAACEGKLSVRKTTLIGTCRGRSKTDSTQRRTTAISISKSCNAVLG